MSSPELTIQQQRAFRHELLVWFQRHRRRLPWRTRRTPYRVWLAELMLQQTRVEQARDYFLRFIRRFPDVRALAAASQDEVLKQWEGLGYYSRARRAHRTAQWLVANAAGKFPDTYAGLLDLPGIGPYTAAAVGSLAFGLDVAVVDGNVARVLSRVLAYGGDVRAAAGKQQLQAWADQLLPPGRSALFNEAVMELGALCCTPRKPDCLACPLRRVCAGLAGGRPTDYPRKPAAKKLPHKVVGAAVIVNRHGEFLIARRHDHQMLGGLWEFPGGTREPGETMEQCIARELQEEMGLRLRVGPRLTVVRHAYSHFIIELHAHWCRIASGRPRNIQCQDHAWVQLGQLDRYPFSRADLHIIAALRARPRPAMF